MTNRERHLKVLEEFYRHHYQYDCGDYSGIGDDVAKAIQYAINSIKTDLKYDLLYEGEELTTKNDLEVNTDKLISDCEKMSFDIEIFNKPLKVVALDAVKNIVNDMPPVTPIRPKGHWTCDRANVRCSCCGRGYKDFYGKARIANYNYCPNCGADMREVEDE